MVFVFVVVDVWLVDNWVLDDGMFDLGVELF